MDFDDSLKISASALTAQSVRLRTIAENLANANSQSATPGGDPYRRKVVTFKNELDRATGLQLVSVDHIAQDASPFENKYDPGNPNADASGYIRMPNVNPLIELGDLREAQESYQANLDVIEVSKSMLSRTVDLLK
jgi:flagellar basal-body rod protein FlgC